MSDPVADGAGRTPDDGGVIRVDAVTGVQSEVSSAGSFLTPASIALVPGAPRPTSKDQCKNGGWQNYGTTFKNQGDCVSFVVTGGRNEPAG